MGAYIVGSLSRMMVEGEIKFNPSPESKFELGDTVIALGEKKNLSDLARSMGA